jgi:molecular chaperone IbpA
MTDLINLNNFLNNAIGFEDIFDRFMRLPHINEGFPHYNVKKVGVDKDGVVKTYHLELALAGYNKEDLDVRVENGLLTIKGKDMSPMKESEMSDFIHRGIAKRRFVKSWQLGEYVKLKKAIYKNGVLTVILKNEIPEEKKPTFIKIEDK